MNGAQTGASAASASRIMGRACITIEEVLELFPEAKAWVNPADYQRVPFSTRTLYHLAKRHWEYILFPAIPCRLQNVYPPNPEGRGFLSVQMIEQLFQNKFQKIMVSTIRSEPILNAWSIANATADHKQLYRVSPHALNLEANTNQPTNYKQLYRVLAHKLNNHYQPNKWYLLSSQVLKLSSIPGTKRLGNLPSKIEHSITYIYAWLLYWKLREKSLFSTRPFRCADYYAPNKSKAEVVLRFGDAEIMIGQMEERLKPKLGIVRSLLCFDKKSE
ncbi:MAG: hypothetical protein Q7S83_00265 [bacterium]|nr:hypothetical protein [bacterium]